MIKKRDIDLDHSVHLPVKTEVKFCMNCDDIDDVATSGEADNVDALRERFQNCEKTGNFDGDICSRLFIAKPGGEGSALFDEDEAL